MRALSNVRQNLHDWNGTNDTIGAAHWASVPMDKQRRRATVKDAMLKLPTARKTSPCCAMQNARVQCETAPPLHPRYVRICTFSTQTPFRPIWNLLASPILPWAWQHLDLGPCSPYLHLPITPSGISLPLWTPPHLAAPLTPGTQHMYRSIGAKSP